ncbi:hypothetical protein M9434_002823 [Picochlorum sp. BPE23]|nr:hypothetical protein M9434_002823 [Picochlorum sp. BPE23]KAI8104867.1 hypothetical protein M9435_000044 [Picochlorum sp. BPE23]
MTSHMKHQATNLPAGFPKGLHVLVVDEEQNLPGIEAQLRQPELQYNVTCACNAMEALELLRYAGNGQGGRHNYTSSLANCTYDIILADARLVAMEDSTGKAFVDACEELPVVLMAEHGSPKDVMRSVQLGAVDFLDKPLSMLKLKTIWQHAVRKMMRQNSLLSFRDAATRPCYSAVDELGIQPSSISGCVPSSMTAPIVPGASTGYVCTGIAGYAGAYGSVGNLNSLAETKQGNQKQAWRSSVDSPQTPSGSDVELAGDSTSAASAHNSQPGQTSTDVQSADGQTDQGGAAIKSSGGASRTKRYVKRQSSPQLPPMACKQGNAPACLPLGVSEWPPLEPGCTWGTPVGGSVLPPPLTVGYSVAPKPCMLEAGVTPQKYLMKSSVSSQSQGQSGSQGLDGEIVSGEFFKSSNKAQCPGPIGLKLKKSDSLLDLINSTLTKAH